LAAEKVQEFGMTAAMPEHLDVVVSDDGTVSVPAPDVARLGARPGEHLYVVRATAAPIRSGSKKVRGILVGQIAPTDLLTEQDFDDARSARIDSVLHKFGTAD
jgi:hypothetical protein